MRIEAGMFARLWQIAVLERRRLLFVTALAFCAGALFYSHIPAGPANLPVPLITGAAYAVVVGPAALLTCVFLPAVRFMIEAIFSCRATGYRALCESGGVIQ